MKQKNAAPTLRSLDLAPSTLGFQFNSSQTFSSVSPRQRRVLPSPSRRRAFPIEFLRIQNVEDGEGDFRRERGPFGPAVRTSRHPPSEEVCGSPGRAAGFRAGGLAIRGGGRLRVRRASLDLGDARLGRRGISVRGGEKEGRRRRVHPGQGNGAAIGGRGLSAE